MYLHRACGRRLPLGQLPKLRLRQTLVRQLLQPRPRRPPTTAHAQVHSIRKAHLGCGIAEADVAAQAAVPEGAGLLAGDGGAGGAEVEAEAVPAAKEVADLGGCGVDGLLAQDIRAAWWTLLALRIAGLVLSQQGVELRKRPAQIPRG